MSRLSVFGLIASLLALGTALPADSEIANFVKRGGHKKHHHKPKHYHNPTYPPPANACPTGTPYYLQYAPDDTYALANPNTDIAVDAFEIDFTQDTTTSAVSYTKSGLLSLVRQKSTTLAPLAS